MVPYDAGIGSCLYLVEQVAQVTFAVCLLGIPVQTIGVGQDDVDEVVIFVDEKIHLLPGLFACLVDILKLCYSPVSGAQLFPCFRWEEVGVFLAEVLNGSTAVFVQSFAVIVQVAADAREVEIQY